MPRTTLSAMILSLLLFGCCGVLLASEAEELHAKALALRKKASVLAAQGNKEQAEQLEREAVELLEVAERTQSKVNGAKQKGDRPDVDEEVRRLKDRLQDLLTKERELKEKAGSDQELAQVRELISGTEQKLKQIHAHHAKQGEHRPEFHKQAGKFEFAKRRIHHLRVAAENLKMAEEHDLAQKLMEQADEMERDVQAAKKRLAAENLETHRKLGELGPDVVPELQEQIERLRAEVKELSQKIEKR